MPAQQGLRTNHAQGASPSTVQSGEREKHQAVVAVESRPPDATTQYDDLLSEQGILGQELRELMTTSELNRNGSPATSQALGTSSSESSPAEFRPCNPLICRADDKGSQDAVTG